MNKLTKLLSVFVIAGAIGTGVAGVAGCTTKTPNNDDNKTTHEHHYTWVDDKNGKCHQHCDAEGECDAPDLTAQEHVDANKNNECDNCKASLSTTPTPGDKLVVAKDVMGLIVEGVEAETITLSADKKSHTIDKSAIKVYFATGDNADVKGAEVPAANLELRLTDSTGAEVSSWENIKTDGVYKVVVSLKDAEMASGAVATIDDLKTNVTITISNPVVADSLAVKTGTLTQGASVQDKMSADWTYTVTLANGDVVDYTGEVTVVVDTNTAGEQTATLTSGSYTGTVKVTITASENHTETYAYNTNAKEIGTISADAETAAPVELFKSANGNTKLEVCGAKVEANGNSAAKEIDGKYFSTRTPLNGATFTSTDTLQKNQRYFILTTEGAAKLTVYWSRNNGTDERGVSVFNSTVTDGDISKLTPGATTIAKATLTTADQSIQKMTVNIPVAGTYWITSANKNNVYFYYIELTTEFEGAGDSVVLEDGANVLANVKVSHDKVNDEAYVQQFTVGDTFAVDSGYSVEGTFVTANTAKKSEQTLTEGLTYWLGETQLVPGTTVLSAELFEKLGENTVTVKYGEEAVTGSYTIFVDSAVEGVTGISASLKSTVNPVLASESAKLTLAKTDIEVAIVGENENAQITASTVKYKAKDAEDSTATEITESVELSAGEYVILVTATVEDATAGKSASFEATVALKVVVEGNGASWFYQGNAASSASDPDIAKDAEIDNNGSFTAKALVAAKSGANQNSAFNESITNSSNAPKTVDAEGNATNASGEAITFVNAAAFQTKAGDGTEYLEITAKKATTIYVYLGGSDDKHGSNRAGAKVYYSINGTTCAEADEVAVTARSMVSVLKVELAAGDVLKVGVKKGTATDPRVWFYGIEAVDVTADAE
ncbi:MAG: hypothetical protein K2N14_03615 [Clostridia bacterium]|nr:hypothetical protein [Clostridia bacterium]